MQQYSLLSEAWYKDQPYKISFPESWDVHILGDNPIPAITNDEIMQQLSQPIGSPTLGTIAKGHSRVAIIVDDLTRPTPLSILLQLVVNELVSIGISEESLSIIVGSGSHLPASEKDLRVKLGGELLSRLKVIPHNARKDLSDLGRTARGTPLLVNETVMENDLRIGIGCIYPHPAASYSGGSKIIAPAVAGAETIRYMHDHLRTADHRGGALDSEFRQEIDDIADHVGLEYIVNVVLNQERAIAGVFCGDKILAHRQGVAFAKNLFTVEPIDDADIVVADMYPFDTDLQFAHDRGFWPLLRANRNAMKIILAACPNGVGSHELYPISDSIVQRYTGRLRSLHWRDLRAPIEKIKKIRKLYFQKSLDYLMVSSGVKENELKMVFPNARLYRTWADLLDELIQLRKTSPTKVAIYRCAPYLIPAKF